MRKILLVLIPILLLNLASALDLTLENPLNSTYTSSLNIPVDFTSGGNNGTCYYTLNAGNQVLLEECLNSQFSVSYDGSYTLDLHAFNGTAEINRTVTFAVDRTSEFEEGKPVLAGIIIIFLISMAFFVLMIYDRIHESVPYIKSLIMVVAIFSMASAGFVAIFTINEYLKFSLLEYWLSLLGFNVFLVVFFICLLVGLIFLVRLIQKSGKRFK